VFADDASGDATPLYTIEGPTTGLDPPPQQYLHGTGHDPWLHRLMVSGTPNTGSSNLGTPFAVPADVIFVNAFDHP